jgi:hypothetical protein
MRIWHWMVAVAVVALLLSARGLWPFAAVGAIVLIPALTFSALVLAQARVIGSAMPVLERSLRPRRGPAGLAVLAVAALLHVVVPAVVVLVAAVGALAVFWVLFGVVTGGFG